MIDTAAYIKERLSIKEVCERYGLHFDTRGRTLCPFHNDHNPSANIKNNQTFHCSPCGIHVDVIGFTERIFNIDFRQTVVRMNEDFHLGITNEKPDRAALDEWKRLQDEKAAEEAILVAHIAEYMQNAKLYRYIWNALHGDKPRSHDEAKRWAGWIAKFEYLNYWFESENTRAIEEDFKKYHPGMMVSRAR